MKQLKITSILLLAIIPLFFSACSDDSEAPAPKSTSNAEKMQLISSSPWTLTQYKFSDDGGKTWLDFLPYMESCFADNTWTFASDGFLTIDEGATKCEIDDPQQDKAPWSFSSDETRINLDGEDWMEITLLNESTLNLRFVGEEGDEAILVFSH